MNHPRSTKRKHDQTLGSERRASPLVSLWSDSKFFAMPTDQMIAALAHFQTDIDARAANRFKNNALLGGGIQMGRSGYEMTNDIKKRMFSNKASEFAKTMWRYLYSLHFAAIIIDELAAIAGDLCPLLCLPVETIEVLYHQDTLGRKTFRYFEPAVTSTQDMRREIKHVWTFFLDGDFLDPYGNICSTITSLMPEVEDLISKKVNTRIADFGRANPSLITEEQAPKNDPNVIQPLPNMFEPLGNGTTPASKQQDTISHSIGPSTGNLWKSRVTPSAAEAYAKGGKKAQLNINDIYNNQIDLPVGRTLANPQVPEAPLNMLEVAAQKKENVFLAFGIPLSMLSNSSSSGAMKAAGGNGGGQKSGGQNSAALEMFYEGLAHMKNFTVNVLEILLNDYYLKEHVKQVQKDNPEKKKLPMVQLAKEVKITITIPGHPSDSVIKELYMMGLLKHSYFKEIMSSKHSIPIDAFNEKPELTIPEMNGIVEKPEPAKK